MIVIASTVHQGDTSFTAPLPPKTTASSASYQEQSTDATPSTSSSSPSLLSSPTACIGTQYEIQNQIDTKDLKSEETNQKEIQNNLTISIGEKKSSDCDSSSPTQTRSVILETFAKPPLARRTSTSSSTTSGTYAASYFSSPTSSPRYSPRYYASPHYYIYAVNHHYNTMSTEKSDVPPQRAPHSHRRTPSEEASYQAYGQNPAYYSPKQGDAPPPVHPSRTRTNSWSGGNPYIPGASMSPYPPSPGMPYPPPQAYSQSGNPLVPIVTDESALNPGGGPPLPPGSTPTYNGSRRKRKSSPGNHRRSNSYQGPPAGYGSIIDGAPPPPSGPPPSVSRNRGEFSPRNEIIGLATGTINSGGRSDVPSSPRPSPANSFRGMHSASPRQSSLRGAGAFGQGTPSNGIPTPDMRVSFSPGTPMNGSRHGQVNGNGAPPPVPFNGTDGTEAGGEAVFLAQKKGGKHRRASSMRKMHMRQRSAQLFMEDVKGVEQIPACRDVVFLLLFLFHLLGIVYLGNTYGYESFRTHENILDTDTDTNSITVLYQNVLYVACLSGLFAITVSALALLLFTVIAKKIVQVALILTIALSFAWGTIGIGLSPKNVVPVTGIIALALSVAYTFIVWDRIPFAAANLNAALSGIRANPGAVFLAFVFQALALAWSIYFTFVVAGVYDAIEVGDLHLSRRGVIALYVVLGVSYYWTFHVFLNIVQVTVSGVIGSWWFTPDGDTSSRNADLSTAFFRSTFYAFGSICYGSLFVGPVRLLRQLSVFIRPSGEQGSLMSLHECMNCIQGILSNCIDRLTDKFNPWAFTYVGLYGYGLADAGHNATELFIKRGWTTIVTDDLVPNVLLMFSLVIGGITGCFAHLIEGYEMLAFSSLNEPVVTSFVVGCVVGLVVTSVLLGIISSSVNAIIVCFAANPVDFEDNHPALSHEMRSAWREVWPGCMDVVDLRVAVAAFNDSQRMSTNSEDTPLMA